jgi:hypothetical protein
MISNQLAGKAVGKAFDRTGGIHLTNLSEIRGIGGLKRLNRFFVVVAAGTPGEYPRGAYRRQSAGVKGTPGNLFFRYFSFYHPFLLV